MRKDTTLSVGTLWSTSSLLEESSDAPLSTTPERIPPLLLLSTIRPRRLLHSLTYIRKWEMLKYYSRLTPWARVPEGYWDHSSSSVGDTYQVNHYCANVCRAIPEDSLPFTSQAGRLSKMRTTMLIYIYIEHDERCPVHQPRALLFSRKEGNWPPSDERNYQSGTDLGADREYTHGWPRDAKNRRWKYDDCRSAAVIWIAFLDRACWASYVSCKIVSINNFVWVCRPLLSRAHWREELSRGVSFSRRSSCGSSQAHLRFLDHGDHQGNRKSRLAGLRCGKKRHLPARPETDF